MAAVIYGCSPSTAAAGATVSVSGSGFTNQMVVYVGSRVAVTYFVNSNTLNFIVPSGQTGTFAIYVAIPGGAQVFKNAAFTYGSTPPPPANPSISSISPSSGRAGDTVTISGANFSSPTVTFGGVGASIISSSSTSLVVSVPSYSSTGSVIVVVRNSDGVSATGTFTYASNPVPTPGTNFTVTGVSTYVLPKTGGQTVSILGLNFPAPTDIEAWLQVGSTKLGDFSVSGSTYSTVDLYMGFSTTYTGVATIWLKRKSTGQLDVSQTLTVTQGSGPVPGNFKITSVSPNTKQIPFITSGFITLIGDDFVPDTSSASNSIRLVHNSTGYRVDAASVFYVSGQEMKFTLPQIGTGSPVDLGTYTIYLRRPDGTETALSNSFTFTSLSGAGFRIDDLAPLTGKNPDFIVLQGAGFESGIVIFFEDVDTLQRIPSPSGQPISSLVYQATVPVGTSEHVYRVIAKKLDGTEVASTQLFTYSKIGSSQLEIRAVDPATGPTSGLDGAGNPYKVYIYGSGFESTGRIYIGGNLATRTDDGLSQELIIVNLPPHASGLVNVEYRDSVVSTKTFLATSAFRYDTAYGKDSQYNITAISPSRGVAGAVVNIFGPRMDETTSVFFDEKAAAIQGVFSTSSSKWVRVIVPPPDVPGSQVPVSTILSKGTELRAANSSASGLFFQYDETVVPTVTGLSPTTAPKNVPTEVVITGTNLSRDSIVYFNDIPTEISTYESATRVRVMTPVVPTAGPAVVKFIDSKTDIVLIVPSEFTFTDSTTLRLDRVDPTEGSPIGNEPVRIYGAGFARGMKVFFGSYEATDVNVFGSTHATMLTPAVPTATGSVPITIEISATKRLVSTVMFSFGGPGGAGNGGTSDGGVTSVTPDFAYVDENPPKQVTITGTGFEQDPTVMFGGVPAQAWYVSSTQINAFAPGSRRSGRVDVDIGFPSGKSLTLANAFLFNNRPSSVEIAEIIGNIPGSINGGEIIRIIGRGFIEGATVRIGTNFAPIVKFVNSRELVVTTPSNSAGNHNVTVFNTNGTQATLPSGYRYEGEVTPVNKIVLYVADSVTNRVYLPMKGLLSVDITRRGNATPSNATITVSADKDNDKADRKRFYPFSNIKIVETYNNPNDPSDPLNKQSRWKMLFAGRIERARIKNDPMKGRVWVIEASDYMAVLRDNYIGKGKWRSIRSGRQVSNKSAYEPYVPNYVSDPGRTASAQARAGEIADWDDDGYSYEEPDRGLPVGFFDDYAGTYRKDIITDLALNIVDDPRIGVIDVEFEEPPNSKKIKPNFENMPHLSILEAIREMANADPWSEVLGAEVDASDIAAANFPDGSGIGGEFLMDYEVATDSGKEAIYFRRGARDTGAILISGTPSTGGPNITADGTEATGRILEHSMDQEGTDIYSRVRVMGKGGTSNDDNEYSESITLSGMETTWDPQNGKFQIRRELSDFSDYIANDLADSEKASEAILRQSRDNALAHLRAGAGAIGRYRGTDRGWVKIPGRFKNEAGNLVRPSELVRVVIPELGLDKKFIVAEWTYSYPENVTKISLNRDAYTDISQQFSTLYRMVSTALSLSSSGGGFTSKWTFPKTAEISIRHDLGVVPRNIGVTAAIAVNVPAQSIRGPFGFTVGNTPALGPFPDPDSIVAVPRSTLDSNTGNRYGFDIVTADSTYLVIRLNKLLAYTDTGDWILQGNPRYIIKVTCAP